MRFYNDCCDYQLQPLRWISFRLDISIVVQEWLQYLKEFINRALRSVFKLFQLQMNYHLIYPVTV